MAKAAPTHPSEKRMMLAWEETKALAAKFEAHRAHYNSADYKEADVRTDFIDKLFFALGWQRSSDPYRQEMKIERSHRSGKGRADYAFSIAPHFKRVRFFVEAKRPQSAIDTADNCFQAIRYSWPTGAPITVLTDFQTIHIIDSRQKPNITTASSKIIKSWKSSDFQSSERFSELYWLLSREAVGESSIERFSANELPGAGVPSKQLDLFPGEAKQFDNDFLATLDDWRIRLAQSFKKADTSLSSDQLTEGVQRVIDRLVFISFLQDKGIEGESIISKYGSKKGAWQDFIASCSQLDHIYNGIVFKKHRIIDTPQFKPDNAVFLEICDELSDQNTPYNFATIPLEILGRIYERFLGKTIRATSKSAKVEIKDDIRKAGGVYYTPDFIVAYMVEQALLPQVEGKNFPEIEKISIVDTACGSGSFLIASYDCLLRAALVARVNGNKADREKLENREDTPHLSLADRRRILVSCVFGCDIDPQAVEVAQLSLYLKLMEDETPASARRQVEMAQVMLPTLTSNVIVANSLIDAEDISTNLFSILEQSEVKAVDLKRAFKKPSLSEGFDLVIGNPPYIKEYTNKSAFDHVRKSAHYQGKMDIWYLFAVKGLELLKDETGILAYIATNNWVTNAGASKLRKYIRERAFIEQIVDFGEYKVFRDASIQTMIMVARRHRAAEPYQFDFRKLLRAKPSFQDARHILDKSESDDIVYLKPTVDPTVGSAPLTFSNDKAGVILKKIETAGIFRLRADEVKQGIVAPQDSLNSKGLETLGDGHRLGEGIFVLTEAEVARLKLTQQERQLLKPYYTSDQLHRFWADPKNKYWIVYTEPKHEKASGMVNYPRLKEHLDRFIKVITSDYRPYGLHRSRDPQFFQGKKILALRKAPTPSFTYSDFDCYVSQTYNIIKSTRIDLLFLTGLLNSRLVRFWLRHKGKLQGKNYQIDKEPLLALPLVKPSHSVQIRCAGKVEKIINALKDAEVASTEAKQNQILNLIAQAQEDLEDEYLQMYKLDSSDAKLIVSDG